MTKARDVDWRAIHREGVFKTSILDDLIKSVEVRENIREPKM